MNSHAAYIEETVEGGLSAYVANQNARYADAIKTGNVDLMTRLAADASRVGFNLSPVANKPAESSIGQIPLAFIADQGATMQTPAQAAAAVGGALGDFFNKGGDLLGYGIVAFVVILFVKLID